MNLMSDTEALMETVEFIKLDSRNFPHQSFTMFIEAQEMSQFF